MRVRIADAHTLLTATLTFMVLPVTLRALLAQHNTACCRRGVDQSNTRAPWIAYGLGGRGLGGASAAQMKLQPLTLGRHETSTNSCLLVAIASS